MRGRRVHMPRKRVWTTDGCDDDTRVRAPACLGTPDALRGERKPDLVQLAMRGGMTLGQRALSESKIKARERIDEWEGMIRVEKWTMNDG